MTREYTTAPAKRMRHPRHWLRADNGGDAYLNSLCQSYSTRPLYPIICVPDGEWLEVVDGNLRLESALRFSPQGGDTELPVCIVTGEPWNDSVKLEIQLESSAHTKALNDYEVFTGCTEWLRLNPNSAAKALADRLPYGEGALSKILSLSKGIQEVKDAAKAGLIGYAKWWPICKLPPEEQPALLAASLGGATRDELQRRSRRQRNGNGQPAVRMPRIKIPLANDIATGTVTVAGEESIDLEAAEILLKAALKVVRAAREKNLDTKPAQSVWRDMAKAG